MAQREGTIVDVRAVARFLVRGTRRAAVTVVGFSLVGVGLAGLVLPILPGWALIITGLLVLSREYSWAYAALTFSRRQAARSSATLRSLRGRARRRTVVLRRDDVVIDLTQTASVPEDADEDVSATG